MKTDSPIDSTSDTSRFPNALIGEGTLVEPDVMVGFRYHSRCGPARLGSHCTLGRGTTIYGDVTIGDYFNAGLYVVIRALVKMGDQCVMGNHSAIEGIVRMGDDVRIMSNTYIPSRTWFGDHVFVGPGVTFLNDKYPYKRDPMPTPRGATIGDDVMIGGGVTVLPGVTIGDRCFIAAGAVVTKDIPARSLVMGVPGRISPLPEYLDKPNTRMPVTRPTGMWDSEDDYLDASLWPDYWPEKFTE